MAEKPNFVEKLVKQPFILAVVLVIIAIIIITVNQKPGASVSGDNSDTASNGEIQLKPPTTASAGQDTPRIMQKMNAPEQKPGSVTAPGLDSLVKGLEAKVEADPTNINNRMLLAQTYNELGMQDKALVEMRTLQKQQPDNGRINLILSSILSRSDDQDKLKESLTLLDKLTGDKTVQQYLVNLYRGDALIRVQDHEGALKSWRKALEEMPAADNRRAVLEKRIAELSVRDQKPEAAKQENKS